MSGKKISELSKITSVNDLATNDLVSIVDVSDLTMGPGGTNKAATIEAMIGPLMNVIPGSFVANKAVIADENSKIAGVSANQLQSLNVTPGNWSNEKALVVDSDGKVNSVSAAQFAVLNVLAGVWENNKALVVDNTGKIANVTQTQFVALNVTSGVIEENKVAVWNNNKELASSTFIVNAGASASLTLKEGTSKSVVVTQNSITLTDNTTTISINKNDGFKVLAGSFSTSLKHNLLTMSTTTHDMSLQPSFIRFDSGASYSVLGPTSLTMNAANLELSLIGLPTSEAGLPSGRVYVDAYGFLKIKL